MGRNALLAALQQGILSPEDLTDTDLVQAGLIDTPQPRYDIAPMQQNTMRAENGPDAGKVTDLNFRPQQGPSWADLQAMVGQGQPRRQMRVVGSGNGSTVDLSPEDAGPVSLDYGRAPVDVPGVGKAYYSKDGRGAYVMGPDGQPSTKVILGYDQQGSMDLNKWFQEQRAREQQIAQSRATTEHTQEETRASRVNNPDMMAAGGPAVSGPEMLNALDPGTAAVVKQMVEGRMAPPAGAALRNPRTMQLLALASQYDPGFDAATWAERYKTAQDFASGGKSGQKVQAINQAIHHAGQFSEEIDKLNNSNILPAIVNPIVNTIESKLLGDPRQGTFSTKATALASELRKVYAGSGGGTLEELRKWEESFDPNAGQDQQRAYLRAGMQLLNGAIESHKDNYTRGMGPKSDFGRLLSPQAQADFEKLVGGGKVAGGVPTVRSDADFNALPSGAEFIGPDGKKRRKP